MNDDKMFCLSNGQMLAGLCYGPGITDRYEMSTFRRILGSGKRMILKAVRNPKALKKEWEIPKVITAAMEQGCCLFDTSRAYGGSEHCLGQALKKYSRENYQIVTKLDNTSQYAGKVREALEKSLAELGVSYVDLYLMHWPVTGHYLDSWKEMEQLYKEGLCRSIGVCNCNIHHLNELEKIAEIPPMVNQFECHPLFTQEELRAYCKEKNIQVMAYTSTARMDERLRKTVLVPIGKKYNKSIAQVILRWHQQIGNIPIVNSSKVSHIKENIDITDFSLTEEEIRAISASNINSRLRYDPDNCDFRQL